ncbi:hypothetical protein ACTXIX_06040 [Glutamicibacter ardleyensis]|uniref:hypothetical protein n=1 Tax=Glutamicibacter ardleyensis TaxID=225894 RepID=UPI003FD10E46
MIKKFSTAAAVTLLTATALSGCGSGKLSAEDTCALIISRFGEIQLNQRIENSSPTPLDEDLTEDISIMSDRALVLSEAAEKTKDEDLKQALIAVGGNDSKTAQLLANKDLSAEEKSEHLMELQTPRLLEAQETYGTICHL